MIYVKRDQTDENANPIRPSDKWFRRAAVACEAAVAEPVTHGADRAIYSHAEVRTALERLFHGKCAYCESKIGATADWTVEHFRPHGRVAEREDHPGYSWLAYRWENLYPSCQHCNERRKDRPRWGDTAELPAGGKAAQFPLLNEGTRAMGRSDNVDAEGPLLIDPCVDDPEQYLGYDPVGQVFSLNERPNQHPSGKKTIEVLHLSRARLRDLRREGMKQVVLVLSVLANDAIPTSAKRDLERHLEKMQVGKSEYAGLARYVAKHQSEFGV